MSIRRTIVLAGFVMATAWLCGCSKEGPVREAVGAELQQSSKDIIAKAEQEAAEGKLVEARQDYQQVFDGISDAAQMEDLNKKVEALNMRILFSPTVDADSASYEVKSGDSLSRIARKNNTTPELIRRVNNLSSDVINIGQRLKVVTASFSIFIDKSQNILLLKQGDRIIKTYRVATGANNSTPVGDFTIVTRLKNPVHFRKDIGAAVPAGSPQNVLGTRWLGITVAGYGIHGNAAEEDLGKQVSMGCIRMLNAEAEELFDIVPQGTKVAIVD
jgi:lipoprotein-anchoring transpeptidase ErfK/SrfK